MNLRIAESKGDYRAVMAMNHLRALSSGLNGKSNVFIPNTRNAATISGHYFKVFVPSLEVDIEVTPDGDYMVRKMEMAEGAFEAIQNGENQKPGMYSVTVVDDVIKITKNKKDKVTEAGRRVVIADGSCDSAEKAVKGVLSRLSDVTDIGTSTSGTFDFFHSPASGRFGGMVSRNPMTNHRANVCSSLLASATGL